MNHHRGNHSCDQHGKAPSGLPTVTNVPPPLQGNPSLTKKGPKYPPLLRSTFFAVWFYDALHYGGRDPTIWLWHIHVTYLLVNVISCLGQSLFNSMLFSFEIYEFFDILLWLIYNFIDYVGKYLYDINWLNVAFFAVLFVGYFCKLLMCAQKNAYSLLGI